VPNIDHELFKILLKLPGAKDSLKGDNSFFKQTNPCLLHTRIMQKVTNIAKHSTFINPAPCTGYGTDVETSPLIENF
jgi:hypothetical protein